MATLTADQRAELRRVVAAGLATVPYTKAQIDLALQAIEDAFEAFRPTLGTAINTATAPFVFTNPQKVLMVKHWLWQKFERGG